MLTQTYEALNQSELLCRWKILRMIDEFGHCENTFGFWRGAATEQVSQEKWTETELDSSQISSPYHFRLLFLSSWLFLASQCLSSWPHSFRKFVSQPFWLSNVGVSFLHAFYVREEWGGLWNSSNNQIDWLTFSWM